MAPSEMHSSATANGPADAPRAVFFAAPVLETLTKRRDFVAASRAKRQAMPGFILQARKRRADELPGSDTIRIGFTCSKKVGNAVARNRAKRRLREVARACLPSAARPGWDYVLIGRNRITAERDFAALLSDCAQALSRLHGDSGK